MTTHATVSCPPPLFSFTFPINFLFSCHASSISNTVQDLQITTGGQIAISPFAIQHNGAFSDMQRLSVTVSHRGALPLDWPYFTQPFSIFLFNWLNIDAVLRWYSPRAYNCDRSNSDFQFHHSTIWCIQSSVKVERDGVTQICPPLMKGPPIQLTFQLLITPVYSRVLSVQTTWTNAVIQITWQSATLWECQIVFLVAISWHSSNTTLFVLKFEVNV